MSSYNITKYTQEQAKKLGVEVRVSSNPQKKIDVFREGKKIASVGATGYSDYPTYVKSHGREVAQERRRLYKLRHHQHRNILDSNAYCADKLLW